MNCANHPEVTATAFCRECGKPMCTECQRPALGSVYCAEHEPVTFRAAPGEASAQPRFSSAPPPSSFPSSAPPSPPPVYAASPYSESAVREGDMKAIPAVALVLGFIPGVGALYNGQYAKGLIHAVVFGLLVSMASSSHGALQPLLGISIAAWVFYMAFEAFHTARKRRHGHSVEEFSSLFEVRPTHGRFPAGAILLIVLGFILLLDTTDLIDMYQLERFWPVALIVFGLYRVYVSVTGERAGRHEDPNAEARR